MEMPSQSVTGRKKGCCHGPGEALEFCDSIGDRTEDTGSGCDGEQFKDCPKKGREFGIGSGGSRVGWCPGQVCSGVTETESHVKVAQVREYF